MLPRHLVRTVNPNGGVVYGRGVEEQFSKDQLLERIVSTENVGMAWKQVRSNKGASGIDNITVEEFPLTFRECWSEIRSTILEGTYPLPLSSESRYRNRMAVNVLLVFRQYLTD